MPKHLKDEQRVRLLGLARAELELALLGRAYKAEDYQDDAFLAVRGCFVTLRQGGDLRGCIGQLETQRPLAELVPQMARAAALEDRRFSPLSAAELQRTKIEISLLTEPEAVPGKSLEEQLTEIRPHVDGVILQALGRRATFLPQVWEQVTSKEEFMTALCHKASLPGDYWTKDPEDLTLYRYQAHHFEE